MRGCQGYSRAGSPWIWTEMPVVQGCRAGWAGAGQGAVPLLVDSYPSSFPLHRMKRIPSGRRRKMGRRHEPPASGLGVVGGPSGPGGGGGERRVQPLFTWLPALSPAPELLPSLPPSLLMPHLHPHCHLPPPYLLHLSSPAGPQSPPSLSFLSLPFPQPAPPSFNSLSFLTSASQPHVILPCPSLPCLIPGSPSSDPFLSDSARTGWGQGWGRAPQLPPSPPLFLYNLIKKRSRFCF